MACSLLAMNAVFGRFFDVLPVEAADPAAFAERTGDPFFIFDVQLHYVSAGYDPGNAEASRKGAVSKPALLGLRRQARRLNPKLEGDRGTLAKEGTIDPALCELVRIKIAGLNACRY